MSEAAPQAADTGTAPDGSGALTAGMVRDTFDHWRIFQACGKWRAFRSGMAAGEGPASLIQPVVTAATLTRLAGQLCVQEWLRTLPAAELEAVWRGGMGTVAP
jgi:hypothetical protein